MKKAIPLILSILQLSILSGQSCSPDSLTVRTVRASLTDSNIDWEFQEHQVFINNDCEQNNKLVIHFVGSFANPASTTYFPSLAANKGFKAISLKYPNGTAAVTACADSNDADCFQNYREEIIFGTNSSTTVEVDENDCIVNRVEKLLIYLNDNFSSENWGEFLTTAEDINWSNILVSGHSQGGGHAAYLAKEFEVNRALMFASPNDYSDFFSAPANWLSLPSATADSNYFAFGNIFDDVVDFNKQFENWTAMNLFPQSDSINVDNSVCNYNNSRILYSKYEAANGLGNHSNVIVDAVTPLTGGVPMFTPVWEYMLGVCGVATSVLETNDYLGTIKLYPNPASSKVRIESGEEILKVEVFNSSGVLLETVRPLRATFELDVDAFEGLLLLKMTFRDSGRELYKKVVVN